MEIDKTQIRKIQQPKEGYHNYLGEKEADRKKYVSTKDKKR